MISRLYLSLDVELLLVCDFLLSRLFWASSCSNYPKLCHENIISKKCLSIKFLTWWANKILLVLVRHKTLKIYNLDISFSFVK